MRTPLFVGVCAILVVVATASAQTPSGGLSEAVDPAARGQNLVEGMDEDSRFDSLSLVDRISQLMLVTLEGERAASNTDRNLLKKLMLGGVVLPQPPNPPTALEYIKWLRGLPTEKVRELPFIIATNVYSLTQNPRLTDHGYLPLPSRMALGAADNPEATRALMAQLGKTLYDTGFNLHLGPNLDMSSALKGSLPSVAVFGGDPGLVGRMGTAFVEAFAEAGLATAPMGFPGGGANRKERNPAVLLTPKHTLLKHELVPYIRAIEAGVPMIHVGTTLVPTLEKGATPACLSPAVMQGLLRYDLGFEGLIIAGPMDAPEVMHGIGPAEAAMIALRAGADLLYWKRSGSRLLNVVSEIATAVENGSMSDSLIATRVKRILAYKEEAGLLERELGDAKKIRVNSKRAEYAHALQKQSVTLVKNAGNLLPLTKKKSGAIGVTGVVGVEQLYGALEKDFKQIIQQPITTARHLKSIEDFEISRLVRGSKNLSVIVVVLSGVDRPSGAAKLIRKFQLAGTKVVVVLVGYPKYLENLQGADAILLTFGTMADIQQSMIAVAEILIGNAPMGILPEVRDLQRKPSEAVTFNALDVMRSPTGRMPISMSPPFVAGYSVVYNPVESISKVEWDFGDGETSHASEVSHAYAVPGRYTVKLSLTSRDGETRSGNFHINVTE